MSKYYLLEGHEVRPCASVEEWARSGQCGQHIGEDVVGDARISTVFLGLNHNFDEMGTPAIFETMIFGGQHDEFMDRYSTYDDAMAGHKRALAMVETAPSPPHVSVGGE